MIQQFNFWEYPNEKKTLIQKDICTPMFIAALFIVAKTGKQPEYLLMGEWIKKLWYTHTHTHSCTMNIISYKKINISYHLQQDGWTLMVLCQVK